MAPSSHQLECVRRAMVEALGASVPQAHTILLPRILHAVDAERLWHLRCELMQALAAMHGEAHAARQVAQISTLFKGLLPDGLVASVRYSSTR